jgi:hypothetical protein
MRTFLGSVVHRKHHRPQDLPTDLLMVFPVICVVGVLQVARCGSEQLWQGCAGVVESVGRMLGEPREVEQVRGIVLKLGPPPHERHADSLRVVIHARRIGPHARTSATSGRLASERAVVRVWIVEAVRLALPVRSHEDAMTDEPVVRLPLDGPVSSVLMTNAEVQPTT